MSRATFRLGQYHLTPDSLLPARECSLEGKIERRRNHLEMEPTEILRAVYGHGLNLRRLYRRRSLQDLLLVYALLAKSYDCTTQRTRLGQPGDPELRIYL